MKHACDRTGNPLNDICGSLTVSILVSICSDRQASVGATRYKNLSLQKNVILNLKTLFSRNKHVKRIIEP